MTLNLYHRPATKLSAACLPVSSLRLEDVEVDIRKFEALQTIIKQFNSNGDPLLMEVFAPFHSGHQFNFDVIYTAGVPAPYDAWTVMIDTQPVVFFNLSEWTTDEINSQGLAVVIHEVTHALLEPLIKNLKSEDSIGNLKRIIIDEGLAHFIGFPGDRSTLLEKHPQKWQQSEMDLERALRLLGSTETTESDKETLLLKSNTGPFWEKYGAISGMFRAAQIYSTQGVSGLAKVITELHLPRK